MWFGEVLCDPRNFSLERGPDENPEKTFFINYIYELPFGDPGARESGWLNRFVSGWRLSGATRVNEGRRFSVRTSSDVDNNGLGSDRPDLVGDPNLPSNERGVGCLVQHSRICPPSGFQAQGPLAGIF